LAAALSKFSQVDEQIPDTNSRWDPGVEAQIAQRMKGRQEVVVAIVFLSRKIAAHPASAAGDTAGELVRERAKLQDEATLLKRVAGEIAVLQQGLLTCYQHSSYCKQAQRKQQKRQKVQEKVAPKHPAPSAEKAANLRKI
jgi:hypothetical protein